MGELSYRRDFVLVKLFKTIEGKLSNFLFMFTNISYVIILNKEEMRKSWTKIKLTVLRIWKSSYRPPQGLRLFQAFIFRTLGQDSLSIQTQHKKLKVSWRSKPNEYSPSLQYSAAVLEIHGPSIYEALRGKQIYY